jgi:hypothetical protein
VHFLSINFNDFSISLSQYKVNVPTQVVYFLKVVVVDYFFLELALGGLEKPKCYSSFTQFLHTVPFKITPWLQGGYILAKSSKFLVVFLGFLEHGIKFMQYLNSISLSA